MTKLTIGMATHTDFHGVYFTIQALRMYHPDVQRLIELVVVDNGPTSSHGPPVKGVVEAAQASGMKAKYVDMLTPLGTSVSRDRIFKEASGKYVLVLDCHVLLIPGAIKRLLQYIDVIDNDERSDYIYSGPMLRDTLDAYATQYNAIWRAEMWGIWGMSWLCTCGSALDRMTVVGEEVAKDIFNTSYRFSTMGLEPFKCPKCGKEPPIMDVNGHEANLAQLGYKTCGMGILETPFEIPGMGLGCFMAKRDTWLGFHPMARGFGGEELYIHEKYRAKGRKAICLPFLQWGHRFNRPDGVKYPLQRWHKVRNYVLEFQEMGWSVDPIYDHFVKTGLMPEKDFQALLDHGIDMEAPPASCTPCQQNQINAIKEAIPAIDSGYEMFKGVERDINLHMPLLKNLASRVDTVTEFSGRRESFFAFAAAKPEKIRSWNMEGDPYVLRTVELLKEAGCDIGYTQSMGEEVSKIEPTGLLFLDTEHTYDRVLDELMKFGKKTDHYIALHDTHIYGLHGSDGKRGVLHAISVFMSEFPEWGIYFHTDIQYGLTVLTKREEEFAPAITVMLPTFKTTGPGSRLKAELAKLGINPPPNCDCNNMAQLMDVWGPVGCVLHRDYIVTKIKDRSEAWGWTSMLGVGFKALLTGLAWKLKVTDPLGSLIDNCIEASKEEVL